MRNFSSFSIKFFYLQTIITCVFLKYTFNSLKKAHLHSRPLTIGAEMTTDKMPTDMLMPESAPASESRARIRAPTRYGYKIVPAPAAHG